MNLNLMGKTEILANHMFQYEQMIASQNTRISLLPTIRNRKRTEISNERDKNRKFIIRKYTKPK